MLISYLRRLFKPRYPTLNRVEIHQDDILANLDFLISLQPQAKIIPVLKANAYGHGLAEICQILSKSGKVEMVAVDSFPEAQIVYHYFKGKVLIMGEMPLEAYGYLNWSRTEVCVYNKATLAFLSDLRIKAGIHLFINSGMNREGIKDLPSFWKENEKYWPHLKIKGFCSHLASAEDNPELNKQQAEKFFKDLEFLKEQGIDPKLVHLGNSAGTFVMQDKRLTAFRPGLALYGYNPFPQDSPYFEKAKALRPALEVISKVVSVQSLKAGEIVSYNATYKSEKNTNIAVIPFGYYEGLSRSLSNRAKLLVRNNNSNIEVPIAGRVCMNLSCLNVGDRKIKPGDEVLVISKNNDDSNSIESLAKLENTISYEVLVRIQANIRKIIV